MSFSKPRSLPSAVVCLPPVSLPNLYLCFPVELKMLQTAICYAPFAANGTSLTSRIFASAKASTMEIYKKAVSKSGNGIGILLTKFEIFSDQFTAYNFGGEGHPDGNVRATMEN